MPRARIDFLNIVQDSQDFGSDDEHMASRVYFSLTIDDQSYPKCHVDVKQPVGADFLDPMEVGRPYGYNGALDWERFRTEVEAYYRSLVGPAGGGIRLGPGSRARMSNNVLGGVKVVSFSFPEGLPGW